MRSLQEDFSFLQCAVLPPTGEWGELVPCPMPNSALPLFPMPNSQCPIPNAQCPIPNSQCLL
ncbi:MAG: hypothetical protein F6J93_39220 [Oscillatoria sp. SIO1A7]|nr:hypothetical protein [Oscillatoria sp. SIO1A7]